MLGIVKCFFISIIHLLAIYYIIFLIYQEWMLSDDMPWQV